MAADARIDYLALRHFGGALVMMLGYNALLFIQIGERSYLWLCVVIAGVTLWRTDYDGLLTTLIAAGLWPNQWPAMVWGGLAALAGFLMFTASFLNTASRTARLHP